MEQLMDKPLEDEQKGNLELELSGSKHDDSVGLIAQIREDGQRSKMKINVTTDTTQRMGAHNTSSKNVDSNRRTSVNSNEHYEEFLHPNMKDSVSEKNQERKESMATRRKNFNSCKNCFRRFDELIMRPFFIYRYDKELISKKAEFMELFLQEADQWEKTYVKEEYDPNQIEKVRNQRGNSVLNRISEMARRNSVMRGSMRSISANNNNLAALTSSGNQASLIHQTDAKKANSEFLSPRNFKRNTPSTNNV